MRYSAHKMLARTINTIRTQTLLYVPQNNDSQPWLYIGNIYGAFKKYQYLCSTPRDFDVNGLGCGQNISSLKFLKRF